MTRILRAGVAGAGVFGGYHANKYSEVDGADLVGVYDPDAARAHKVAEARGVEAYTDLTAFLDSVGRPHHRHASEHPWGSCYGGDRGRAACAH